MIEEMALNEPRQATGITQERLAKTLRINQAGVSRIESRSDIFVSRLRKAIEAMGGNLEIRAKFPAGEVRIRQFGGLSGRRRPRSRRSAKCAA
jgi:transcriptional regulator with XRE-family HTH domain